MTPQELLLDAHKRGISLFHKAGARLGFKPVRLCPPGFREELRTHKAQLLALLADLERCGASDDGLILKAMALFDAQPKGLVESPSLLFPVPVGLPSVSEKALYTTTPPMAKQATFWK